MLDMGFLVPKLSSNPGLLGSIQLPNGIQRKKCGREATGPYRSIGCSPTRTGFAFSGVGGGLLCTQMDNVRRPPLAGDNVG